MTVSEADLQLTEHDMPALFHAADRKARGEQRVFLRLQKAELGFLVAAAALGEPSWSAGDVNASALASVGFLIAAVTVRIYSGSRHPERDWYDARAVAESTKTLAWQYAVASDAFPLDEDEGVSLERFLDRVRALARQFPGLDVPAGSSSASQATEAMIALRRADLNTRRRVYTEGRVLDQQTWYSTKAAFNRRRARLWGVVLLVTELTAALLGVLRALQVFDVDWSGLLVAVAASVIAWRQTKQYESLSASYAVTSHDVASMADRLQHNGFEEARWATVVHDSEAAFSREHTVWLARRQAGPG